MMNPETHHTFICDEPRYNNILKYHDEHNNILKYPEEHTNILIYIVVTQKHYEVQNVKPNFQLIVGGSQDT